MATIQLILNALNNASKPLQAIAASALETANRIDDLNNAIDELNVKLGAQMAAVDGAANRMNDLADAAAKATAAQTAAAAATAASGTAAGGAAIGWGRLAGQVALFGGVLSISVWHAVIDAVIEFGTTLLQAATAVVAFGAFSAPTFQHISVQLGNVWTASNALNTSIYPLQASFSGLARAVQPEAYQLFGEALVAINQHAGEFQQVASQAGLVLDQLGGRLVAAVGSGNGFSSFLKNSAGELNEWGAITGNVGGILGNFFRVLPGYAQDLTAALKGVTGALEALTGNSVAQWFMNVGLAMHGAILWGGLLVTGLLLLRGPLTSMGTWFAGIYVAVERYVASIVVAEGATATFAATVAPLAAISPFGWVVIAAAALAGLVVVLHNSSSATQQLTADLEQLVQNSPINALGTTLSEAISATTAEVNTDAAAAAKLAAQYAVTSTAVRDAASRLGSNFNPALRDANNTTQLAQQGLTTFQQQADLVNTRVGALSKTYGSNAAAMGLMTEAGITSAQITSTNTETWKAAEVQIQAVADANNAMALGAGRNAAAMNALNYAGDTTSNVLGSLDVDMQKTVTGMDDITNVVLGGEQALFSFATGLQQFQTDAAATGAVLGQVTTNTGKLSAASITLGTDYYSTMLPAMQKTIDAMELQLPTTTQLTAATGDMAAQLYPVAKGNQAATASLITLINNALGPGTVSFQNLESWIAKNGGSLSQLNQIIGQTTTQASILANTLGTDLNASFAKDILQATGAQKALSQYTSDLVNNTQNTAAGQADRAKLIADLEQAGLSAQQAEAYVTGLSTSLGKLQSPPPIMIRVEGVLLGSLQALDLASALGAGGGGTSVSMAVGILSHASGGIISGPGTRVSDSVPALLSKGEYVVRADSVDKYGKQMMDLINSGRYARGGLVSQPGFDFLARRPVRFADGGEVGPSPFSVSGSGASGPVTVTGLTVVEQLLTRAVADLDQAVQLLGWVPGATAAGVAAATTGRPAAYSAIYSTRG